VKVYPHCVLFGSSSIDILIKGRPEVGIGWF